MVVVEGEKVGGRCGDHPLYNTIPAFGTNTTRLLLKLSRPAELQDVWKQRRTIQEAPTHGLDW